MFFRPLLNYFSALLASFFGIFHPTPPVGRIFFQHLQKIDLAFEYILSFIDRACVFFGSWLDIFTLKKIDLSLYLVWWHFLYF